MNRFIGVIVVIILVGLGAAGWFWWGGDEPTGQAPQSPSTAKTQSFDRMSDSAGAAQDASEAEVATNQTDDMPEDASAGQEAPVAEEQPTKAEDADILSSDDGQQVIAETNGETEDASEDAAVSFDVVRVEKNGDTVMAGRAPEGGEVRILDGTTLLGTVTPNRQGEWVYILETPLAPGTHELSLTLRDSEGEEISGDGVVVVDVPEVSTGDEDTVTEGALAVVIPKDKEAPSRVVQTPRQPNEDAIKDGELALDSVDYDDEGQAVIGGSAKPGQRVVGYLNNEFVGEGEADEEGRWSVIPEEPIEEGLHQLRIDQVNDEGKVTARVEIPFSRSAKIESMPDERIVKVQPGNSLWRISRAIYGEGAHYTVIYERNRDQIRDPDLIYPGQIFVVPADQ